MIRRLIGKVWKLLPRAARVKVVRATQTQFTVSVAAIVVNENKEVLMLDHVLRPRSGWGFPGGFLDANEPAMEAIRREVAEETGLELADLKLRRALVRARHLELIFSARPIGHAEVKTSEIYRLGWFARDSLPEGTTMAQSMLIGEVLADEFDKRTGQN